MGKIRVNISILQVQHSNINSLRLLGGAWVEVLGSRKAAITYLVVWQSRVVATFGTLE